MELKASKKGGDENLVLLSCTEKQKGKCFSKGKRKSEESSTQPRNDLCSTKLFICHKLGNYASQFLGNKEEKGKQQQKQVRISMETQMNGFAAKFEKYFSLISFLSTNMISRNVCSVDREAYLHITSTRQLFSSLMKQELRVQVELGDDAKYSVVGVGTISF